MVKYNSTHKLFWDIYPLVRVRIWQTSYYLLDWCSPLLSFHCCFHMGIIPTHLDSKTTSCRAPVLQLFPPRLSSILLLSQCSFPQILCQEPTMALVCLIKPGCWLCRLSAVWFKVKSNGPMSTDGIKKKKKK